jgi:hypothetical protein
MAVENRVILAVAAVLRLRSQMRISAHCPEFESLRARIKYQEKLTDCALVRSAGVTLE